ncbi:ferrochelatase [Noviherbaspirillum denitrificans]|uniref:Ferrochelatase n=1 Tax=Noviherbaspirillum denitrificans TaxID=1968433 RepID=A0A254T9V0_9BURK|nr:ferrochelatase [Noviherbaspirillum denitrificans]OWW19440.1 ferrochelatase [Noviherbaspirillum denitrificans]
MRPNPEPPFSHGTLSKTGVVLVNLGTPDEPTTPAVRRYLKQFLSDPRMVEIPRAVWWLILNGVILPFRSSKSAAKYASIWTQEGSPLMVHTKKQAALLRGYLGERGHDVQVAYAMRYGSPSLPETVDKLKADGCERILILPAYPQYSATTTASIFDAVFSHYAKVRNVPELRFVKHYHDNEGYIDALKKSVLAHWEVHGRPDKLVMSFHGVPKRTLLLGDPYHCECHKTARLLAAALRLTPEQYIVTFQSRFGKAEWLQPYTAPTVQKMGKEGVRRIDVLCPGFTSDCLETLEEIAMEVKQDFLTSGGKEFHYIPCLNEDPTWIVALAEIAEQHMAGWPTMLTPQMREDARKEAEVARQKAMQMGAKK